MLPASLKFGTFFIPKNSGMAESPNKAPALLGLESASSKEAHSFVHFFFVVAGSPSLHHRVSGAFTVSDE